MTDWWTCTIDDPESADLDDALSVRPRIDGGWEVAIHIADPSEWVAPDSGLDRFARFASTSLYLPTGVEPMLPEELSERVMSLVQGRPRPAMTTQFSFSKHLEVEQVELFRSTVHVDARLDYNTVDAVLMGVPHPDLPTDKLTALRFIADEFHLRRMESGAVTLKLPEVKLRVDIEAGEPRIELAERSDSPSRSLIQEWMVAANVAAARYCSTHDIPALYRTQEPPDGDLEDAEILSIPPGVAREFARLKRMRRGEASLEPAPHAGLGVESYIQVTSPIRRYMDLVMQRQIAAHLEERPLPYTVDELDLLRSEIERSVFEARKIEQRARKYWMIYALGQAEGPIEAEVIDQRSWSDEVTVFLTQYGYRAECGLKESAELGDIVQLDVTRAEPRRGALSLREARPG
jgi:exoribonuclease-2